MYIAHLTMKKLVQSLSGFFLFNQRAGRSLALVKNEYQLSLFPLWDSPKNVVQPARETGPAVPVSL